MVGAFDRRGVQHVALSVDPVDMINVRHSFRRLTRRPIS
jgi:hypothetical protein